MPRQTTVMSVAVLNYGDAKDEGVSFTGTWRECVAWMVQTMAPKSMAGRFKVCFARSESEALADVRSNKKGKSTQDEASSLVDELFAGLGLEIHDDDPDGRVPDDTYKG